jgi:peptidyl-prolyl cis-trans isomerase D
MIRFLQTPGPFKKYALGGILLVICVSMVWYLVPNNSPLGIGVANAGVVGTVAGEDIHTAEVQQQAKRMVDQQFPRGGAQAQMLMPYFAQRAFETLVNEKVLIVEARRLGLKATDDDLRDYLHQGQLGQMIFPNGNYSKEAYEDLVSRAGYTIPQFEALLKEEILINKIRNLISSSASVTDAEVRDQFNKQNTKIKFDYAVIKKDDILKGLHPADAELKAYFDLNQKNYVNSIPEKRQLKYVVFDTTKALEQTQVTQQDLQAYYDAHRDEYRVPEQVNVRHILIKSPLPGPDGKVDPKALDAARAKAQDVLKQVKAGGHFADLAKKYSEDTTAKEGGSLGWIGRGKTVPEFEKAAFSLPKGGTSDLIQTSYGFHIIHVDDKQDAHMKSVDEVKGQIEPLIKQQKASQAAQSAAAALVSQARNSGSSLDKAAAAKGLQVISTDFVTRNNLLPGIGTDPQFSTAAFAQTANAPADVVQLHDGYAVYEVAAIKPPSTPTFDEARGRVEQEFKDERASSLLAQKTQELSDRAKADHDLKKAAKELGAEFKTSDFVAPDGQVPEIGSMTGPAAVAFSLKPGEISGPINSAATGTVLAVTAQQAPTDADFAAKKDQIRDGLLQQKQAEVFGLFLNDLHDKMQKSGKVKTNQKELDALTKARTEEGE